MGRINDGVKVVASSLNTFHGLIGLVFTGAAAYAIHSTYRSLTSWLSIVLALGIVLFLASVAGCAGMHRQVIRRGRCTGRCILSFYQLAMTGLLALLLISLLSMRSLTSSLKQIIEAPGTSADNAPYSRMESQMLAPFFDQFYFRADEVYGQGKGGYGWFVSWTTNNCPGSMSLIHCDPCMTPGTYVPEACCPRRDVCAAGESEACPYKRCRKGVAIYLQSQLSLFQRYGHVLLALQLFVLLNTCLLICYNPRDSLADLLEKTGILVQHDNGDGEEPRPASAAGHNRRSRRRSPRSYNSPRLEQGGGAGVVASPTAYRTETPHTYPMYGGSQQQRRSPQPPVAVAYPLAADSGHHPHPHSMV